MTPEQTQEVARLRSLNLSPKQIARQLGLRPAEVTAFIKAQATELAVARALKGELAPIERCLINEDAAKALLDPQHQITEKLTKPADPDDMSGLAQIFVTRLERNRYSVCTYLVDYWCLGVKNAMGPRKMEYIDYVTTVKYTYEHFEQEYREITLEQAQAVIFGAVDYADRLGLKPHDDFEEAKAILGARLENLPEITFGRDGKPFYINGPYDNPKKIIAKLNAAVGEGNFDFMIQAPEF